MTLNLLTRRVHYWLSAVVALPLFLVIVTGLLLQVKKQVPWVQPAERRGTGKVPVIGFDQMLAAAKGVPEAGVTGWDDITRVDVRPAKGLVKLQTRGEVEVQLDAGTGAVLQVAARRSDLIESFHDGSAFGDGAKLGVFLPSGVVLLVLWFTGLYLFALPRLARRRKRAAIGQRLGERPV
jgi:uncharacterized iron-regulated membrane protein